MVAISGPESLEKISKESLLSTLLNFTLSKDYQDQMKFNQMKDFLDKSPIFNFVRNEFLYPLYKHKKIINKISSLSILRLMKLLLHSQMKELKVNRFSDNFLLDIFDIIKLNCPNLEILDLTELLPLDQPNLTNQILNGFSEMLGNLKMLRVLRIHTAYDIILNSIFINCSKLEELHISLYFILDRLDEKSIQSWKYTKKLKILSLGDECRSANLTISLVAKIISHFPNLKAIGGNFESVGYTLKLLAEQNPEIKINFIEITDKYTSLDVLNTLIDICPKTEKLHLMQACQGVIPRVIEFKCLKKLVLRNCFSQDIIKLMDSSETMEITHLEITRTNKKVNFHKVLKVFPKLIHLISDALSFEYTSDRMIDCPKLKYLHIYGNTIRPYYFDSINMPNIEHFEIINWRCVSHNELSKYISETQWDKLKYLKITNAKMLNLKTLFLLMKNCPSMKHIHDIHTWNISKTNYLIFRQEMIHRNFYFCVNCDFASTPF